MFFFSCTENSDCDIVVKSDNPAWGVATGGGTFKQGSLIELRAVPVSENYVFVKWNDDDTNAFRTVTVSSDSTFIAYFDSIGVVEEVVKRVKVSFDGEEWEAAEHSLQYSPSTNSWRCIACQNPRQSNGAFTFPMVTAIFYNTQLGISTYQFDSLSGGYNNGLMRLEYTKNHYFNHGGTSHGDYWAYYCILNITEFDATTLKLSAVVDATMADIYTWTFIPNAPLNPNHTLRITIDDMDLTQVSKGLW